MKDIITQLQIVTPAQYFDQPFKIRRYTTRSNSKSNRKVIYTDILTYLPEFCRLKGLDAFTHVSNFFCEKDSLIVTIAATIEKIFE